MYYEINVSQNGQHFFATAKRSISDPLRLKEVYEALASRFSKEDGFELSITRYEELGRKIDPSSL
jgi:hypothetical protein